MIWVLFAALSAAALAGVLIPLLRADSAPSSGRTDAAFYRDQLAEIERDLGRGLLTAEDADAARAEAARRLLAAAPDARAGRRPGQSSGSARRIAALALVLMAPALAVGVYLRLGRPERRICRWPRGRRPIPPRSTSRRRSPGLKSICGATPRMVAVSRRWGRSICACSAMATPPAPSARPRGCWAKRRSVCPAWPKPISSPRTVSSPRRRGRRWRRRWRSTPPTRARSIISPSPPSRTRIRPGRSRSTNASSPAPARTNSPSPASADASRR
ncbi:MAG: c-type cytochrome biogenesis protein CcmI [Rhizobiales bacterium]|nr:c-type cytochrome biogenesis protein CcmI [Hyphomicrobiales bacterium]